MQLHTGTGGRLLLRRRVVADRDAEIAKQCSRDPSVITCCWAVKSTAGSPVPRQRFRQVKERPKQFSHRSAVRKPVFFNRLREPLNICAVGCPDIRSRSFGRLFHMGSSMEADGSPGGMYLCRRTTQLMLLTEASTEAERDRRLRLERRENLLNPFVRLLSQSAINEWES